MDFDNKAKNHGKIMELQKMHPGKIMEFCFFEIFLHATFDIFFMRYAHNWSFSFHINHGKCRENHGKIMEFHLGKWLETLTDVLCSRAQ